MSRIPRNGKSVDRPHYLLHRAGSRGKEVVGNEPTAGGERAVVDVRERGSETRHLEPLPPRRSHVVNVQ